MRQLCHAIQETLLVLSRCSKFLTCALVVMQEFHSCVACGKHSVEHSLLRVERRVLRQIADGHAFGKYYAPLVRFLFSGDEAQQGSLARAIDADQSDAVTGIQPQTDVFKERSNAVVLADCFDG